MSGESNPNKIWKFNVFSFKSGQIGNFKRLFGVKNENLENTRKSQLGEKTAIQKSSFFDYYSNPLNPMEGILLNVLQGWKFFWETVIFALL